MGLDFFQVTPSAVDVKAGELVRILVNCLYFVFVGISPGYEGDKLLFVLSKKCGELLVN